MQFDDEGDNPTPEEIARWQCDKASHLKIGLAMVGRRIESAVMLDNGTLMMSSQGATPDGQLVSSNWDVRPDDPAYRETCQTFRLEKPGDSFAKEYRLVDDKWVDVHDLEQT